MANTQISISRNGVTTLATAGKFCDRNVDVNVSVPSDGITHSGTKSITSNGTHDVTSYASASVNVPVPSGYIKPSGSKTITENGTHDVTSYASAVVNVPTGGGSDNYHVVSISFASALGAGTAVNKTLVSNDSFVKANYNKEAFFAMLLPLNAAESVQEANVVPWVYQGNRALVKSKAAAYGARAQGNGASSYAIAGMHTSKISQSGYVLALRATSTGTISLYVAADYTVPAGDYLLVCALAE
jgi:hypothetical protein